MVQDRAASTRTKIIDAAVELFDTRGYGDTHLHDVITSAGVTKGAFYYHFLGKGDVAAAIIEESYRRFRAAVRIQTETGTPALENLIRATFISAHTMDSDRLTHIGYLLAQGLWQISSAGSNLHHLDADLRVRADCRREPGRRA